MCIFINSPEYQGSSLNWINFTAGFTCNEIKGSNNNQRKTSNETNSMSNALEWKDFQPIEWLLCHCNTYTFDVNVCNTNFTVCISTTRRDACEKQCKKEQGNENRFPLHWQQILLEQFHRFVCHWYLLKNMLDCLTNELPRVANVVNDKLKTHTHTPIKSKLFNLCWTQVVQTKSKSIITHSHCDCPRDSVHGLDQRQPDLCDWNRSNLNQKRSIVIFGGNF